MNRLLLIFIVSACIAILLGSCAPSRDDPRVIERRASEIASILAEHNAKVERITSLWARVSVRLKGTDSRGKSVEEQGEGHLQILAPDSISLTVGKLGETYFAYGSTPDAYWMIDLSDSDAKAAVVGDMAQITPEKADALGLGVHPSDLIVMSGLVLVDPSEIVDTRWVADDVFAMSVPSRWGSSELWFDVSRRILTRVVLFDVLGVELASSRLGQYKPLMGESGLDTQDRVPGVIEVVTPNDDGFVRIAISEPRIREIRPVAFDLARLLRAYRVREIRDLDELIAPSDAPLPGAP